MYCYTVYSVKNVTKFNAHVVGTNRKHKNILSPSRDFINGTQITKVRYCLQ